MNSLECKVCNFSYDEEDLRPHYAPCGHGLCSACLEAALNKKNIFQCPTCRKKRKIASPEDLPVNFDLIDVIREFKTKSEASASGTETDGVCNIHRKTVGHWCIDCEIWMCDICLDSHSISIFCRIENIKSLKESKFRYFGILLSQLKKDTKLVKSKIQEYKDMRKVYLETADKLGDEANKLIDLLKLGSIYWKEVEESKTHLLKAVSPHAVSDRIKELHKREDTLFRWSTKIVRRTQLELPLVKNFPHNLVDLSKFGSLPNISEDSTLVCFELSQEEGMKGRVQECYRIKEAGLKITDCGIIRDHS